MSIVGKWNITVSTPMGEQTSTLTLNDDGTGTTASQLGSSEFTDAKVDGDSVTFSVKIDAGGQEMVLNASATAEGDSITGKYETPMGDAPFSGKRIT